MKLAFWKTVSDCLVEFFDVSEAKASVMVSQLRGELAGEDGGKKSDGELIYHSQPIHVASDLMGREPARDREFYDRYRRIQDENLKVRKANGSSRVDTKIAVVSMPARDRAAAPKAGARAAVASRRPQAARLASSR